MLDTEMPTEIRGDTERPEPAEGPPAEEERPSRVGRKSHVARGSNKGGGKGKVLLLAVVGAVVLAGSAAGVYLAFFNKTNPGTGPGPGQATNTRKVTVSKGGGENTVPTLREALLKVGPGDTIVIAESKLVEPTLTLRKDRHKDITIESATADGKPAVIEYLAKGGVMFDASNVEGFRLRNVEFDGKGQAEIGVQVSGSAAGVTLEGVTVRNVQKTGVHLWNLAGVDGRPVTLDRVRVVLTPTSEAGVLSYAANGLENKFVTIKNSRFEGPGRAGLRVDGAILDFDVSNNRFYNLSAGVVFVRPGGRPSKGTFANNTFYQMPIGLHFDCPPPEAAAYALKVAQNYFAKTNEALKAHARPPLDAANNLHDPASGPGNPPLPAARTDATLAEPNPNDDATFLRFPNPLSAGGQRVGAN